MIIIFVMWGLLGVMWLLALVGLYIRGNLDALDYSMRVLRSTDLTGQDEPWRTDWGSIAFYVGPLLLFTGTTIFITLKLVH
jgi:hypothetical protein